MTTRVPIALLGCGHFFHAPHWAAELKEHPRAEFVGVWDHDPARARVFGRKCGVRVEPDLTRLLARPDLEAVAICSENDLHADLVVRSARAGKHVLCEKPPAFTFRDLRRMEAAVCKAGVVYFQSFPKRFDPVNLAVKAILDEGRLGRLAIVRMRHGHFGALPSVAGMKAYKRGWFTDPARNGGGSFLDEGVHAMDCLQWFCGRPKSVLAKTVRLNRRAAADEGGIAVFEYAGGMIAEVCTGSVFAAATNTVEIFGERGALVVQGTDLASKTCTPGSGDRPGDLLICETRTGVGKWRVVDVPTGFKRPDFHRQAMRCFVDCVAKGKAPPVTLRDGHAAVEMVLAGYESARTGGVVRFPFARDRKYRAREVVSGARRGRATRSRS